MTNQIRNNIAKSGGSELKALEDTPGLRTLWEQRQELAKKVNAAKKEAIRLAVEPFLEEINDLDQQYAMLLQLTGENGDST